MPSTFDIVQRGIRSGGVLATLLVLAASGPVEADAARDEGDDRIERTVFLMGTELSIRVSTPESGGARPLSERIVQVVAESERWISSWSPTSELMRATARPAGTRVALPDEVVDLVAEARAWRDATGDAFNPDVGALVDAWGLRSGGRYPTERELEAARTAVQRGTFSAGPSGLVRTAAATWIDTGAFGKGWALRRAAAVVRDVPGATAEFDFGGQLVRVGPSDGSIAPILLAHPGDRGAAALEVRIARAGDLSVAVSGNSERGIEIDGVRLGHLLDPRSGRPATFRGSVAVLAADPMVADLLSTALFVLGPDAGRTLVERLDDIDAIWLHADGRVDTTLDPEAIRLASDAADAVGRSVFPPPATPADLHR